jgi:hypothetical protein
LRHLFSIAVWAGALLGAAGAQSPPTGVVVDAIAALVNHAAITRSEVDDAAWFARFSGHSTLTAPPAGEEWHAALLHVIDEHLLLDARRQEGYGWAPAAEVEVQWARWVTNAGGDSELDAALSRAHLDADTARELILRQLTIVDMLDQRLGGAATVSDAEAQAYYDSVFLPQARRAGIVPAPLAAVRDRINAIVEQQKISAAETEWLAELRQAAEIDIRIATP